MERTLRISSAIVKEAVVDKDRFEGLCFSILIKAKFTNSLLYAHSIREMKSIFGMGQTKLKRVLNNAIKFGYITKEGDSYRSLSLIRKKSRVFRISPSPSFKDIDYTLRGVCMKDKVLGMEFFRNTIYNSRRGTLASIKENRKKIKRYGMHQENNTFNGSISKGRLSKVLCCSKSKLNKVIRSLVQGREIEVVVNTLKIDALSRWGMVSYNDFVGKFFIRQTGNEFYLVLPNKYRVL